MWKRKRYDFRASASTEKGPLPPLPLPHPWFVYAYVKKANNRKSNDEEGGGKQKKQVS